MDMAKKGNAETAHVRRIDSMPETAGALVRFSNVAHRDCERLANMRDYVLAEELIRQPDIVGGSVVMVLRYLLKPNVMNAIGTFTTKNLVCAGMWIYVCL